MHKISILAIAGALLSLPFTSQAAPSAAQLHQQSCTSCHGSEVYTRPDHHIRDKAQLNKQVRRCAMAAGAKWFDDEIQAVADFLDSNYYHFGR